MRYSLLSGKMWRTAVAAGVLSALALGSILPGAPGAARAAGMLRADDVTPAATVDTSGSVGTATAGVTVVTATATMTPTATSTATARPRATARPTLTATPVTVTGYSPHLPRPVVHRTNGYQIGAYYFSGWSHAENNNLTPLLMSGPFRRFEPIVGWYDDSQAQVDKNILQASTAGINFFAFDYYDTDRSRYNTDRTLNEAIGYYLRSTQRYRLNFALAFIDQAPFLPRARDWPHLVDTWLPYLRQPDYVRVNGKPLFIIFSPEHMREIFGSPRAVHTALDYLRGRARRAGLPGLTIAIGATVAPHGNAANYGQVRAEGYDVTTGYNYHALGGEKYRTPVPYDRLVQENRQMWDRVARTFSYPYIPVITSGWDQRFSYREQKTAIIYAGRTPARFACYAAAARQWVDHNARRTVPEKMVLVFAWNETGEGGAIIPNHVERYAYTAGLLGAFNARRAPVCG